MERSSSITYQNILDTEIRVSTRSGEMLQHTALTDAFFLRQLEQREILPSEFATVDGLSQLSQNVVASIELIGGKGSAIRILGLALANIDNFATLNDDREMVVDQMTIILERLRKEHKIEKKEKKRAKSESEQKGDVPS